MIGAIEQWAGVPVCQPSPNSRGEGWRDLSVFLSVLNFCMPRFPKTHTLTLSLVRERASISSFGNSMLGRSSWKQFFDSLWSGRGHPDRSNIRPRDYRLVGVGAPGLCGAGSGLPCRPGSARESRHTPHRGRIWSLTGSLTGPWFPRTAYRRERSDRCAGPTRTSRLAMALSLMSRTVIPTTIAITSSPLTSRCPC